MSVTHTVCNMTNFIDPTDYNASIHREILSSLLRETSSGGQPNPEYDSNIVEVCEDRAIDEMRAYLDKTYDCEAIFLARGAERHSLILMFALDITIYHIFCIHNPYKISDIRKERYDRAIEWLKGVAKGDLTISGAPRRPEDEQKTNSPWQIEADRVRPTIL